MVSPSRADAWKSRGRGCWGDSWQDGLLEPTVLCSLSLSSPATFNPHVPGPSSPPHPNLPQIPHSSEQTLELSPPPLSRTPTSRLLPKNLA